MNQDTISKIAAILEAWNPLGERAGNVEGLDGYKYEAIDIISTIRVINGEDKYNRAIKQVLGQSFDLEIEETKLREVSKKIEAILKGEI
ncbi:MAG TPA: DUF1871 family protein [Desulfuromonadales bacterium]|nr:DUF1871 family protein [Desulfuromonadales bacterium]